MIRLALPSRSATAAALGTVLLLLPAGASAKPHSVEARDAPWQQVPTKDLSGPSKATFEGSETWGAPCYFEEQAFHDSTVFAALIRRVRGERTYFIGGVDTAVAPLDLGPLSADGKGAVIDPRKGEAMSCLRRPGSLRFGGVVLPYKLDGKGPTLYALVRVELDGKRAPTAVVVAKERTRKAVLTYAQEILPAFDQRTPAGWKGFLVEGRKDFCLREGCGR